MSTADEMLVPGAAPPGWQSSPWVKLALWLVILLELVTAVSLAEVPYYAISPGTAEDVTSKITGPSDRTTDPEGEIRLTTVRVGPTSILSAFTGWLDPDIDIYPEKLILGDTREEDRQQETLVEMDLSKETAIAVALRRLGNVVTETGTGGLVVAVGKGYPAAGHLNRGDTIVGVDGVATTTSGEVVKGIKSHKEGEVVRLDVERAERGTRDAVELTLAPPPEGTSDPVVGIQVQTRQLRFTWPFPVDIDTGGIGGPSAGLAFTLGVIDVLSPGELTGGRSVAVTGTIDLDGNVGEIGGVGQKALAVREAGVKYFLVPAAEVGDARKRVGSAVQIIGVKTLEDALDALGRLGGDLSALRAPAPSPR